MSLSLPMMLNQAEDEGDVLLTPQLSSINESESSQLAAGYDGLLQVELDTNLANWAAEELLKSHGSSQVSVVEHSSGDSDDNDQHMTDESTGDRICYGMVSARKHRYCIVSLT